MAESGDGTTFTITLEYSEWDAILSALYYREKFLHNDKDKHVYVKELDAIQRKIVEHLD